MKTPHTVQLILHRQAVKGRCLPLYTGKLCSLELTGCHPSLSSVCLSNLVCSCVVLGTDLHREHSWGRDRCQGLHHHLRRSRGHRGAVPWQIREPHQQVRERNGRRDTLGSWPCLLSGLSHLNARLSGPEGVLELCGVSCILLWAFDIAFPL